MNQDEVTAIFENIQNSSAGFGAAEIIAAASVVIALSALIVAILESRASRKHNKLSVAPKLHFTKSTDKQARIKILLCNFGLGPGLLTSFSVTANGVSVVFPKRKEIVPLLKGAGFEIDKTDSIMYMPDKGESFKEGNEVRIFEFIANQSCSHSVIEPAVEQLTVVAEFETLYGEKIVCRFPNA